MVMAEKYTLPPIAAEWDRQLAGLVASHRITASVKDQLNELLIGYQGRHVHDAHTGDTLVPALVEILSENDIPFLAVKMERGGTVDDGSAQDDSLAKLAASRAAAAGSAFAADSSAPADSVVAMAQKRAAKAAARGV